LVDSFFVRWKEDQEKEKLAAEAAKAEAASKAKGNDLFYRPSGNV
jgi:hypothetical protein